MLIRDAEGQSVRPTKSEAYRVKINCLWPSSLFMSSSYNNKYTYIIIYRQGVSGRNIMPIFPIM